MVTTPADSGGNSNRTRPSSTVTEPGTDRTICGSSSVLRAMRKVFSLVCLSLEFPAYSCKLRPALALQSAASHMRDLRETRATFSITMSRRRRSCFAALSSK
jgi:hypothetical protein